MMGEMAEMIKIYYRNLLLGVLFAGGYFTSDSNDSSIVVRMKEDQVGINKKTRFEYFSFRT